MYVYKACVRGKDFGLFTSKFELQRNAKEMFQLKPHFESSDL